MQFIVNYRVSVEDQVKSGFYVHDENATSELTTANEALIRFQEAYPDRAFDLPLERFSLERFNELLDFLGESPR